MNKKIWRRSIAFIMCMVLVVTEPTSFISQAVHKASNEEELQYDKNDIIKLLDENVEELTKKYPKGQFTFIDPGYGVKRDIGTYDIYVLRMGGSKGAVNLEIETSDLSATYGKDYEIGVKSGDSEDMAERNEDAMQFFPTEDMHDKKQILSSNEYMASTNDTTTLQQPNKTDSSRSDIQTDKSAYSKTPSSEEPASKGQTLQDFKSELFDKDTEQTTSFYKDTGEPLSDLADTTVNEMLEDSLTPSSDLELSFADGERYKILTVAIYEGSSAADETFHINLSAPDKEQISFGSYTSVSVVLEHEGETEEGVISFRDTKINVETGNPYAEVTLKREGGKYTTALAYFSTISDTAKPGKDYTPVQRNILFMPGDTEVIVSIPLIESAGGNRFICRLERAEGAALHERETVITITNNNTSYDTKDDASQKMSSSKTSGILKSTKSPDVTSRIYGPDDFIYYDRDKTASTYILKQVRQEVGNKYVYTIGSKYHGGWDDKVNHGIIRLNTKLPTVAFKKLTVDFASNNYDSYSDSWTRTWDTRLANTLTMALWKPPRRMLPNYYIDPSQDTSSGIAHSRFLHRGEQAQEEINCSLELKIPDDAYEMSTLTLQQQHINDWCTSAEVHIKSVTAQKRTIRFSYLPHDPFVRRDGYLSSYTNVTNLFTLESVSGTNTKYYIDDTVAYNATATGGDEKYKQMIELARNGIKDQISNNTSTGFTELPTNAGFNLNNEFFQTYSNKFTQDKDNKEDKIAYIKPAYNKEALKANISLVDEPNPDPNGPDGSAELGFIDSPESDKIKSLSTDPAYMSESIILRAKPNDGCYFKGYEMKYTNYNDITCYRWEMLTPEQMETQKDTGSYDMKIPVDFLEMEITPLYTEIFKDIIHVTVDNATREHGVAFEEGDIEAVKNQKGDILSELALGKVVTLFATAKSGYMPVWTTESGTKYSGNSYDFVLKNPMTKLSLSFQKADIKHSITGIIQIPDITINTLKGRGENADKVPKEGVTVAAGFVSAVTDKNGNFTVPNEETLSSNTYETRSVAGTKRTVRLVDGILTQVKEFEVPSSGSDVNMGTLTMDLPVNMPSSATGEIRYSIIGRDGNQKEMVSKFGSPGSKDAVMYRYDAISATGDIGVPNPKTFSKCIVTFHDKNGNVHRTVEAKNNGSKFSFDFDPIKDTAEGGAISVTMLDKGGSRYGPYRTGITAQNPPTGDFELVDGPNFDISTSNIKLPIVKLDKPNFSSGTFQAKFTEGGFEIIVGFDVSKIQDKMKKTYDKNNKEKAQEIDKAKDQAIKDEGGNPKDANKSGSGNAADINFTVIFACKLSFSYFNNNTGKVVPKGTKNSTLAMYSALFYMGFEGEAEKVFPFSVYGIPFYIALGGELSVAIIMNLYAEDANHNRSHFNFNTFSEHPTTLQTEALVPVGIKLKLSAGIGGRNIISGEIGGQLGLDFEWFPWDKGGTGTLSFNPYVSIYVLGFEFKADYAAVKDAPLFDTTKKSALLSSGEDDVDYKREWVGSDNQEMIFGEVDNYPSEGGEFNTTLIKNVLKGAKHEILSIGNGKVMVIFLAEGEDRDHINKSALHYSIFKDGSEFTDPVQIEASDGTLDTAPHAVDMGDKVFISWANAAEEIDDPDADIRDILTQFEINGIFYNKATEELSDVIEITKDSTLHNPNDQTTPYAYSNVQPHAVYNPDTEKITVFYLKEDFNHTHNEAAEETIVDFMNGQTTVAFAEIDTNTEKMIDTYQASERMPAHIEEALYGQRLLDVGIMKSGLLADPKIEGFTAAKINDYTAFSYQLDLDQDASTTDDTEVMLVLRNDNTGVIHDPFMVSGGIGLAGKPEFVNEKVTMDGENHQICHLIWREDNEILHHDMDEITKSMASMETLGTDADDKIKEAIVFESNRPVMAEDYIPNQYVTQSDDDVTAGNEYLIGNNKDGDLYKVSTEVVNGHVEMFACFNGGDYTRVEDELVDGSTTNHRIIHDGAWGKKVHIPLHADSNNEETSNRIILKDITAAEDGGVLVLYEQFVHGDEAGDLKIVGVYPRPYLNEEIEVSFDKEYPRPKDVIKVNAAVKSAGLIDSEDVTVKFYEEHNGTKKLIHTIEDVFIPSGDSVTLEADWIVPDDVSENTEIKVEAAAIRSAAEGSYAFPTMKRAVIDDTSYAYLKASEDGDDLVFIEAFMSNNGNMEIPKITAKIDLVDMEALINSSNETEAENAYTELASVDIENPFAENKHVAMNEVITLPKDEDAFVRELRISLYDENGNKFEGASKTVAIQPSLPQVILESPDTHIHTWSKTWKQDASGHWRTCTDCNEAEKKTAHNASNWIVVTAATTKKTGLRNKKCTVCDYVIAKETIQKKPVAKKRLSTPKKLKLTSKKAEWKSVKYNSGYTLVIYRGKKKVKTIQIKKGKTSYKFPKKLRKELKKGKTIRFTLVAKGKGKYKNSKMAKSKVVKIKK